MKKMESNLLELELNKKKNKKNDWICKKNDMEKAGS